MAKDSILLITPLVETIQPRRECLFHNWSISSSGGAVEKEVYTCLHCGATRERTIHYGTEDCSSTIVIPEWPTWREIALEP
jgi:hypothetical protein